MRSDVIWINGEKVKKVVADYWSNDKESKDIKGHNKETRVICRLCPHGCKISHNQSGICGARTNIDGVLYATNYGKVTSIALDPIEKKPLYHFHSGKKILSLGSYGCNFRCPFCQNFTISLEYENVNIDYLTPEQLAQTAVRLTQQNNIGVAYTYNEPLIGFEYVRDSSRQVHAFGLMNVLVTNGYINEEPLSELLPYIDAMNIDIKGGTQGMVDEGMGTRNIVIKNLKRAREMCHVEVTTLIVPNENESDVEEIARQIAEIDKKIPYHLSRFFPKYKYSDRAPTPLETMYRLRDIAEKYLDNVHLGNV